MSRSVHLEELLGEVEQLAVRLSTSRSSIDRRCFIRLFSFLGRHPQLDAVVAAVDLREAHPHVLARPGGQVLAHEVGPDRQLAVAAVDQDRELHRAWAAELGERVERGADGAAGEEHVVDQHHDPPADVDGDLGGAERRDRAEADVVAVEGDVERADRDLTAFELLDGGGQAAGDRGPAGVEADEDEVVGAVVALDDLVGDAGVGPAQVAGVEHTRAEFSHGSSRRSLTGLPSRSAQD